MLLGFLPFLRFCFLQSLYAAFFGGRMPRVSRSFSSEKSYSPSMLIWAHDMGEWIADGHCACEAIGQFDFVELFFDGLSQSQVINVA